MQMHIKAGKGKEMYGLWAVIRKAWKIDVPFIMECMKDHKYWPKAICSHPTFEGDRKNLYSGRYYSCFYDHGF